MAYTTIKNPSDYFNTKLYTGNGATNAITGVGFQPDFIWIKERSSTSSHNLVDAVRGVTKRVSSDNDGEEETLSGIVSSFDSDGFTNGADNGVNESSQTYASWNWLANGAGVANTDGSVTATVSANQTSGFSVIKLTNPASGSYTVGHGLGVAPDMLIFKALDGGVQSWFVLHKDLTNYTDRYLRLQGTGAEVTYSMQTQVPTNSLLYLNSGGVGNGNAGLICYAFAGKQGYSKFGSYTGNGNADGTFVYTGFKPAFVITKNATTGATSWEMADNKRALFNVNNKTLKADTSGAEQTYNFMDFLSNGFKLRYSSDSNTSGNTIIYMAFAEEPLVGDNPATAR